MEEGSGLKVNLALDRHFLFQYPKHCSVSAGFLTKFFGSEQSLVWWLDTHQANIDRGLTAVVGLVLECLEQPRIAGICDIAHARDLAIFAWIQSFYILNGNVVAFTYI